MVNLYDELISEKENFLRAIFDESFQRWQDDVKHFIRLPLQKVHKIMMTGEGLRIFNV